jgi:hypothetical protein
MKISKQAQRDARQLFRSCQVNGLLDENRVRQAVKLLSEKKPRGYVEILSRLHRLVKMDLEQRTRARRKRDAVARRFAGGRDGQLKKKYGAG